MKTQLKLDDAHRQLINKCMRRAGYPAALARECKVNRMVFQDVENPEKKLSWGTWLEIVAYARRSGVVGPFFDPITLAEPPSNYDLDKEIYEAAWMLQHLDGEVRTRIVNEIAAEYGKQVARSRDGQATIA